MEDTGVTPPNSEADEQLASISGDLDSDSLPDVSASDQPGAWLSELEVDDARWIDGKDENAMDEWGSATAAQRNSPFNPATAFQESNTEEMDDSDSNHSDDGWSSKNSRGGSASKRQRIGDAPSVGALTTATSETVMTAATAALDEDDERSSGDVEGADIDSPEDVIRALGPSNVRELASLHSGEVQDLPELKEDSDSDMDAAWQGGMSGTEDRDGDSSEDMDYTGRRFCINCTEPLDPEEDICGECGHDCGEDAAIFSAANLDQGLPAAKRGGGTVLAFDNRMAEHQEGKHSPHPERPDRIKAVIARLMSTGLADRCLRIPCREATRAEVLACHTEGLFNRVATMSERAGEMSGQDSDGNLLPGREYLTGDTYLNSSTFRCARLAAGGCVDVAAAVVRGEASNGAAVVRPPGHHAESGQAMGFCFFNNAAVAARAAQAAGARRVLILDWDVHHGNGTQHIFENDPSVLYMSIHRYDGGHFFPGTGAIQEVGKGPGEGYTVNVPWPCGNMGNAEYIAAFTHVILPIAYQYCPDIIIVSAGFDAAKNDPLGGCRVTSEGFAHMTAMLQMVAPLAVLLEGGYNLSATAAGTEACLRVLLGERPPPLPQSHYLNSLAMMAIQSVLQHQAKYWRCLRGLVETPPFNPFTSPFAANASRGAEANGHGHSHTHSAPPTLTSHGSRDLHVDAQGHKGERLSTSSAVEHAINRTKFISKSRQGRSAKRWQLLHALHLMALRHHLRTRKSRVSSFPRSPRSPHSPRGPVVLPHGKHAREPTSPGRRHSLKNTALETELALSALHTARSKSL